MRLCVIDVAGRARLPGRRWRWLGFTAAGAVVGMLVDPILRPTGQESRLIGWHNPLGLPAFVAGLSDAADLIGIALTVLTGVAALVGLVVRFRRGPPECASRSSCLRWRPLRRPSYLKSATPTSTSTAASNG